MKTNRSAPLLVIMASIAVVACGAVQEDTGATHEPSPGSDTGAVVEASADSFVVDSMSIETETEPIDVAVDAPACSPPDRAARWAAMDADAIRLPNHAATLDLVGASGAILTLDDAEKILCSSTDLGDLLGDGSRVAAWGASNEVQLNYDPTTRAAKSLELETGYTGHLTATDPDGHEVDLVIGEQITRDTAPFTLPVGWRSSDPDVAPAFDALYRALMNTYAPTIASEPAGTTCVSNKVCAFWFFGDDAAGWFVNSIGFDFSVDHRNAPEPIPSVPTHIVLRVVAH